MSNLSGTNIAGPIVPFTTDDTYPTHYALYGKGGWKSVTDITARDAIPAALIENGALVYVISEEKPYIRKSNAWEEFRPPLDYASGEEVLAAIEATKVVSPGSLAPLVGIIDTKVDTVNTSGGLLTTGIEGNSRTIGLIKASLSEVSAAIVDNKAITPAGMSGVIYNISEKVPKSTVIRGGGLITGDSNLETHVTLTVAKALSSDITDTSDDDTKAVTPASMAPFISDLNGAVEVTNNFTVTVVHNATTLIRNQTMFVQRLAFK